MSLVYVYEEMPADLETNGHALIDWADLPEINRILNGDYTFYGNYSLDGQNVEYLKEDNFIRAEDEDGKMKYFEIKKVTKNLNSFSVTGRAIGYMLSRNFIESSFTQNGTGSIIMSRLKAALAFEQPFSFESDIQTVHQFTVKQTNPVDAVIGSNNGNENLASITAGELDMDNYRFRLLSRIGKDNGYRVDLGVNLESIEEEIDGNYYNSLYLIGGVPEGDYDEDKEPITYKYLELTGVTDKNRRIGKYENSELTTVEELKKWGQSKFDNDRVHEPSITHTVSMVQLENTMEYEDLYDDIARLHFGDTCYCTVAKLGIEVAERMIEYTWYPTLGKYKSVTLGNDIEFYTNATATETAKLRQKVESRTELMVEAVRNASSWITGTKGGYVRMRPEKAPSEILIMDKPSVTDAQKVWRWNLGGLGYSSNGVDGPYGLAMTQDGAIVADFITAGILSGILVQGVALKTLDDKDFQLVAEGGQLSFEKKVISTGLDDVHGESLGSIVATYGGGKINGFAVWKEPNYIFSINAGDGGDRGNPVFQIPADVTADKRKYNLYGDGKFSEGNITIDGRLDVKELYVNGVKIDTNGGDNTGGNNTGGNDNGWNGQYPPEVTTDRDKRYWQIWAMAIGAGFTKQAAAALLGNAQGESDADPKADEGNGAPGFGYGVWQWTDSSGATSGRVYMINLMTKAGISDDPDTITAQFKLLMWHAPNGQWIATSAYPYTWTQFMNLTDINTAAQAFMANFERPRDPHPERTTWAQEWYDKFKDLEIPASKGYIKPIADPIRVTSEFGWRTSPITDAQEFHNGIDLVNGNPNTPIFASADGEVIVAGDANYFDWYGNWVVIKHSDGMYTGYAHLSSVNVSKGSTVTQGQQIGVIGTTGPSTGIHLHFQFFDEMYPSSNDHFFNPRDYIDF
ncbi:phage tail tip lysozyme [Enterococcus faecium]|uniref:phage tail tip lysozyme n=1 Tax=Enterococcus faecium TaxID=1352 RepID=UPI0003300C9B|nr:phage tail tip lysozyme [Enterococcus faecium]EOF69683.1 phage minor structural protein [Enterococcus faecium EnGen0130]